MRDINAHPLWEEKEEVVEAYIERAALSLQGSGRIPLYDGATEDPRYENIISVVAEDLYDDDLYYDEHSSENA